MGEEDRNLPMREKLDFKQVLFEYMILFGKANDVDSVEMITRKIESTLSPYKDKTYTTEMEKLKTNFENDCSNAYDGKSGKINVARVEQARWSAMFKKYDFLMGLARRKGLLPEETVSHIMGEEL
jgi:hypothetical protein